MRDPKWLREMMPTALVLAFLSVGCASQTHVVAAASQEPMAEALASRATLEQLRDHRYAKEASRELARAETWLDDADRRVADGNGDHEATQLTLVAVRTQVAAIKAFFLRREAQDALEDARAGYAAGQSDVRDLQQQNRDLEQ